MSTTTIAITGGALSFIALVAYGFRIRPRLDQRLAGIESTTGPARTMGTLGRHSANGLINGFVAPYRGALAVTVTLALSDTVLGLAGPWPLKLIIDNAIGARPLPASLPVLGGMSGLGVVSIAVVLGVGLVLASAIVGYLVSVLVGTISLNIAADLRVSVFDRLLHMPVGVHDRHRSGDLVTRLTGDVSRVQEALVARIQVAIPGLATMLGMSTLMLWLDPTLALIVLAAVPPLTGIALLRQRRVAEVQRVARTRSGDSPPGRRRSCGTSVRCRPSASTTRSPVGSAR